MSVSRSALGPLACTILDEFHKELGHLAEIDKIVGKAIRLSEAVHRHTRDSIASEMEATCRKARAYSETE